MTGRESLNHPDATTRALRLCLLSRMSEWSEDNWAAGWMSGLEEMLYAAGGEWEILGRTLGWPLGWVEPETNVEWVSWEEAGRIFAERNAT